MTSLHVSSRYGHSNIVRKLVASDVDVNCLDLVSYNQFYVFQLHHAFRFLVQGLTKYRCSHENNESNWPTNLI